MAQDRLTADTRLALQHASEVAEAEARYRQGAPSLGPALAIRVEQWYAGVRDEDTIIRLLFLIWYVAVEPAVLTGLPTEYAGPWFAEVFESAGGEEGASPLVLWAVGRMAEIAPWAVGEERQWSEASGRLLERARRLRPQIAPSDFARFGVVGDYFRRQLELG